MNDLEGALLFAGIPLGTVVLVWALVFGSTRKSKTGSAAAGFSRPVTRSSYGSGSSSGSASGSDGDERSGS